MFENRCPMCNRELELDFAGSNVQVLCKCGVSGPDFDDPNDIFDNASKAIAAWNYLFPKNAYTKIIFIPPNNDNFIIKSDGMIYARNGFVTIDEVCDVDRDAYEMLMGRARKIMNSTNDIHCQHKWKNYQGLVETYEYCELCNEKRK